MEPALNRRLRSEFSFSSRLEGSHRAAWEQPELLVSDLRAAFKQLR